MKIDEDNLDYVEAQVARLTAFRLESMELLNKRAQTLITLQIGGGGGLAAFAVNLFEKKIDAWIIFGVVAAAVCLLVLAVAGVLLCMFTERVLPPGNEPAILLKEINVQNDLLALRVEEISTIQERQEQWKRRNERVGVALNFLYFFTAMSPFLASGLAAMAR